MKMSEKRILELDNKYESKIYLIDDEKLIYKLDCRCGDFKNRKLRSVSYGVDVKVYSKPCKHLKPIVDTLIQGGYILKTPKKMEGTDKPTAELRRILTTRSGGMCESCNKVFGEQIHRKIRKWEGGKYNEWNCMFVCKDCHKGFHSNEFTNVQGK